MTGTCGSGPMAGAGPLTVLYIAGAGRSGSTLLDRLAGELPGFAAIGEARYLWGESLGDNRRCGCGARFLDCPFWSAVGCRAFGGWHRIDPAEAVSMERSISRHRHIPVLAAGGRAPARWAGALRRYLGLLVPLYAAIRDVSGAGVIVDSTKDAAYAHVLRQLPGVDLRLLHLVRHSCGVAWSWSKPARHGPVAGDGSSLRQFSPVVAGVRWAARNLSVESLAWSGVPRLLLRYETLVADPAAALAAIGSFAGRPPEPSDLAFLEPGGARLGAHHTVAGNPMRMTAGRLDIRADEAWRTGMPYRQQAAVCAVTWPLMRRYAQQPLRPPPGTWAGPGFPTTDTPAVAGRRRGR